MTFEFAFVIAVVVVAGFVRGALGFGDALVAMPLLAFVLPTTSSAPLVALLAGLIAVVILVRDWRHVELRPAVTLTAYGMLAVPAGVWLLRTGDDRLVRCLLGGVVTAFSVWSLRRPGAFALDNDRLAPLFGISAGLLGGAYNTAGPPLVIFGTLRRWSPLEFRATLQTYCLVASAWVLVIHGLNGLITEDVLHRFAIAAPLVIAATLVGRRLTSRLPTERFVCWVHVGLLAIGTWLILSSTFQLVFPSERSGSTTNRQAHAGEGY